MKKFTRRFNLMALTAVASLALLGGAQAQTTYPSQPIKFIVPYAAGGATDALARMVAQKVQDNWQQPVLVENKPGAGGTIGADQVAKAPGDGHTVLFTIVALLQQIKLMKPSAIVINTARGKVIDEEAVAKAIAEGRLRGAAIDAFEEEPLGMDSPLRQLGDKVLLSPHSASFNEGGELRPGIQWALRAVLSALRGEVPDNVYNKEVIPRWREKFGGASLIG